jgi:hypothetical protein
MDALLLDGTPLHSHRCPCNDCVRQDANDLVALGRKGWTPGGLPSYLQAHRSRPYLNWSHPPGHCAICGGDDLAAGLAEQHYWAAPYNAKAGDHTYTASLVLFEGGIFFKMAKGILDGKNPKQKIAEWTACFLGRRGQPCLGVATRDIANGLEIRMTFDE